MNKKMIGLPVCLSLLLALTCTAKTQTLTSDMETFLDSTVPGIRVQVNATSRAQPNSFILITINLTSEVTQVYVKTMRITVYGFVNGTEKSEIYSNTSRNFMLYKTDKSISQHQVFVPEHVYGITYGEIYLDYNATVKDELGFEHPYSFQDTLGFTMTRIENVYLKSLEEQLANLRGVIEDLNQTFRECFEKNLTLDELASLNQTYWQLMQENESFQGIKSELDNARTAMVFLTVVAVFFVATTAYLVLRKPKSYL